MVMPMPAEWSFGTTIPAKDLDGTRRFYEGVLGAQVVMEDPEASFTGLETPTSASTPPSPPGRPSTPWAPLWSRMSRRRWPSSEARA
jgi:catechol 2,3-dioxygenase-like lactoylglutathione lyase family enzyme